jgi:hypothetical protein
VSYLSDRGQGCMGFARGRSGAPAPLALGSSFGAHRTERNHQLSSRRSRQPAFSMSRSRAVLTLCTRSSGASGDPVLAGGSSGATYRFSSQTLQWQGGRPRPRSTQPKLASERIHSPAQFVMLCAKLTHLTQVTVFAGCSATLLVVLTFDPVAFSALRMRMVDVVAFRPVFNGADIGHTTTV